MVELTKQPGVLWRSYLAMVGSLMLQFLRTLREIGAFAVITLGVMVTPTRTTRAVVRPLIFQQLWQSGVRLLPMLAFLALALGMLIVGQTVALLTHVGAQQYI